MDSYAKLTRFGDVVMGIKLCVSFLSMVNKGHACVVRLCTHEFDFRVQGEAGSKGLYYGINIREKVVLIIFIPTDYLKTT